MERHTVEGPVGTLSVLDSGASGDGLPAVFVHGINGAGSHWEPVAERLAERRRCIVPDLRGHGASVKAGPFAADDYLGDVLAVVEALGVERFHVLGTSFGGQVALALASKAPERVASMVVLGSTLRAEGLDVDAAIAGLRAAGPEAFFGQLLRVASFMPGTPDELIDASVRTATEGRDVDLIIDVSRTAFAADATPLAADVQTSALVLSGAYDMTCPVPQGKAFAKAISAGFTVLPGRGHMAMLEDPDAVAGAVAPFLEQHD